jgi:hypothetical protein
MENNKVRNSHKHDELGSFFKVYFQPSRRSSHYIPMYLQAALTTGTLAISTVSISTDREQSMQPVHKSSVWFEVFATV